MSPGTMETGLWTGEEPHRALPDHPSTIRWGTLMVIMSISKPPPPATPTVPPFFNPLLLTWPRPIHRRSAFGITCSDSIWAHCTWMPPLTVAQPGSSMWTQPALITRTFGKKWNADLSNFAGDTLILRWRGISATGPGSDMAIDDVHFFDLLEEDAGIASIDSPTQPTCSFNPDVWVTFKNYGTDTLTSVQVRAAINGTTAGTLQLDGLSGLPAGYSPCFFKPHLRYRRRVKGLDLPPQWGSRTPLAVALTIPLSLTASLGLSGNYAIGGAGADYPSFSAALDDLELIGVCGPVTFLVHDSTFTEQLELPVVTGSSLQNTITFRSASGNRANVILRFAPFTQTDNFVIRFFESDYYRFEEPDRGELWDFLYKGDPFRRRIRL